MPNAPKPHFGTMLEINYEIVNECLLVGEDFIKKETENPLRLGASVLLFLQRSFTLIINTTIGSQFHRKDDHIEFKLKMNKGLD